MGESRSYKENNPYGCISCGKRYKNLHDLYAHQRECGKLPSLCCPYCEYKSNRKFNVNKHIKNKHKGKALVRYVTSK